MSFLEGICRSGGNHGGRICAARILTEVKGRAGGGRQRKVLRPNPRCINRRGLLVRTAAAGCLEGPFGLFPVFGRSAGFRASRKVDFVGAFPNRLLGRFDRGPCIVRAPANHFVARDPVQLLLVV